MKHTPEPWTIGKTHSGRNAARVHAPNGDVIADLCGLIYDNPDAARIVACVNACAGIEKPEAISQLVFAARMLLEVYDAHDEPAGWIEDMRPILAALRGDAS